MYLPNFALLWPPLGQQNPVRLTQVWYVGIVLYFHYRSSIICEESSRKMEQYCDDKFPLSIVMENISLFDWNWNRKFLGLSCVSTSVCCVQCWLNGDSTSPQTHSSVTNSTNCRVANVSPVNTVNTSIILHFWKCFTRNDFRWMRDHFFLTKVKKVLK